MLLGVVVAIVASSPAFAFLLGHHYRQPVPVPAPDLAVGGLAAFAAVAAYVAARLAIGRFPSPKTRLPS